MGNMLKIFYYEIRNIIKGKWIIGYTLFFVGITIGIMAFSQTTSQFISGILNIILLVIPLTGIMLGSFSYYNSKEFIELLLTQPINRTSVFLGKYLGLSLSLASSFVLGVSIPIVSSGLLKAQDIGEVLDLLISGVLLYMSFIAIAFMISIIFDDKIKGLGLNIIIWLYLSIIHDAIILAVTITFSQYPLEKLLLFLTLINPIDLARIMIVLKLDIAALLGYTGAVFSKFFGSTLGIFTSFSVLLIWVMSPLLLGLKIFNRKDF